MRVLHVIPSLGPARGGPGIAARTMASAAARLGADVHVVASNDNDRSVMNVPLEVPIEEAGVQYTYFARTSRFYTRSRKLSRWLREHMHEYDVAHLHALFTSSTVAAAHAAQKAGTPYIVRPLGTLARYGMSQRALLKRVSWLLIEKHVMQKAALVHFTSHAEKDEAQRLGRWPSVVVPLAIDTRAYQVSRAERNGYTVLFMSRIHRKKRLEEVLRAIAQLPEAKLVVAGAGDDAYVQDLKKLAHQLEVSDRVDWRGHVSGPAKSSLLAEAHVFVLPSINENFGVAVAEALASGMPAVVSRGVAIHREITDAGAGLVADSASEVAAALRVLADRATWARMGANAARLASDLFDSDRMGQALLAMYQRAAGAA